MELKKKNIIVFIVYKAGWWGCFDSLYHELSMDETKECLVLPIPYYERKEDNSSIDYKKKHYEAKLLPRDIPVVDYKTYDMKVNHPDTIYIHNPYDNQNPAEAIEEMYYSENLKKNTDLLIYIPHMLYLDGLPDNMKTLTVYKNADQIILANEDVVKDFKNVEKGKLIITGSPLVDYVEKLSSEKPDIPEEWKKALPNGKDFAGKRVILYHTSYHSLLYETESALKKINYVLDYMKKRKDIVFIWRPEPGIERRFEDLPNTVAEDYLNLCKRFVEEKIGIYDTTEDSCIAAVLADAYLGDEHPEKNLFGIQGKPISLLNRECKHLPSEEELCSVSFIDCTAEGDDIWFVTDEYNIICKMNLASGKTSVIAEIPDEASDGIFNYCGIVKEDSRIYLNPHQSDAFVTYNIESRKFLKKYLSLPVDANFDYIVPYKEYLFLKAKFYPAIIQYNTLTEEYTYHTAWVEGLEKYTKKEDENEPWFLWGVVVCQDKLMLASSKANVIMEFNMDTGDHKFYEVGPQGSKYFGMEYDGENFWLIPYLGKNIVCWNYSAGDYIIYSDFVDGLEDRGIPYRAIIKLEQSLMIFPYQADFSLKVDLKEKKIRKMKFNTPYPENTYQSEFYQKLNTLYAFAKILKNGMIVTLSMYDASILLINIKTGKIRKLPCRIPLECVKDYYNRLINNNRDASKYPCSISENYTLRVIMDYCVENKCLINNNEKLSYYSKIWRNTI